MRARQRCGCEDSRQAVHVVYLDDLTVCQTDIVGAFPARVSSLAKWITSGLTSAPFSQTSEFLRRVGAKFQASGMRKIVEFGLQKIQGRHRLRTRTRGPCRQRQESALRSSFDAVDVLNGGRTSRWYHGVGHMAYVGSTAEAF